MKISGAASGFLLATSTITITSSVAFTPSPYYAAGAPLARTKHVVSSFAFASSSGPVPKATHLLSTASSLDSKGKVKGISSSPTYQFITDCDNINTPPSLSKIFSSIHAIKSGSDIRGVYTDHKSVGSILNVSQALSSTAKENSLTPFAAFCYGAAFAQMVQIRSGKGTFTEFFTPSNSNSNALDPLADIAPSTGQTAICIGRDPRLSGTRLSDAFCRGVESIPGVIAYYTGLASTPAMFQFCRSDLVDGAVMVTASHLPQDRNGLKFFTKSGGLTKRDIEVLAEKACSFAREWHDMGVVPPSSGNEGVYCSSWVDYMPTYESFLKSAICREIQPPSMAQPTSLEGTLPLAGLRIVLNAGNGSGYFFNEILHGLGADVSNSIHLTPDGTFPGIGAPNPEYGAMIDETKIACENCSADIGIMLDTDADRCGFILPRGRADGGDGVRRYEALNRNRLIALLAVIYQSCSPGCTFVTDR